MILCIAPNSGVPVDLLELCFPWRVSKENIYLWVAKAYYPRPAMTLVHAEVMRDLSHNPTPKAILDMFNFHNKVKILYILEVIIANSERNKNEMGITHTINDRR